MFPPTFPSQSVTNDSRRKIRTRENWAAKSSSVVLFKMRQASFFLELCQPHGLMSRETVQAASQSHLNLRLHIPTQTIIYMTIHHKQRPCWKFLCKTAPVSLLHSPSEHLSLCYFPLSTLGFLAPHLFSLVRQQDYARIRFYNVGYSFIIQQIFIGKLFLG